MKSNKVALIAGVAMLVLLGGGFFLWHIKVGSTLISDVLPVVSLNGTSTTQSATPSDGSNTVQIVGGISVEAPSLQRAIPAISPDLDAVARAKTIAYLNTSVANIQKNKNAYQDWINLGLARQMLGDYAGAEEVWVFCTKLSPTTPVAFSNLGYLYTVYIKNAAKAESNYKQALVLNPKDTNTYRSLAELYTYYYKKDTNAAELIYKEGIAKNPAAYDLGVLLARYYKDKGMIAEAKLAYTSAAAAATSAGKSDIATAIATERDQLK